MTMAAVDKPKEKWVAFAPLRDRTYAMIWTSSIFSNFGQLILGVGAAWEMTRLTNSPTMVALVQSALMLPLMLVAVPAGAMADMFDRRKIAIFGLVFATCCAAIFTTMSWLGMVTPWIILTFCALIGVGVAVYSPAWQASVREQVKPEHLPAAVALGSVSYNVARSFGPAVGGLILLVAGATAVFAVNGLCYLPLMLAFFLWKREAVPSRLPPERLDRAIISGARYAIHSPPIRSVLLRALVYGFTGAALAALMPIIARDLLDGNAATYGLLLGANGVGAIGGALLTNVLREHMKAEHAVSAATLLAGVLMGLTGLSHNLILTMALITAFGACSMAIISLLNIGIQLSAPRWVTARALSWFQSALTGGVVIGAWFWGHVAGDMGVGNAMIISGIATVASPLVGLILPLPRVSSEDFEAVEITSEPEVALALTARSGPIVVEIDYHVDPAKARDFYDTMLKVQRARQRNGAFGWSLARDIADPVKWTERYHCPTWGDYLRQRSRFTQSDRDLHDKAMAFRLDGTVGRVRRQLERPFGSVRWRAETPDVSGDTIPIYTP